MSNITIEEMVAFKKQATEWVDKFWSKGKPIYSGLNASMSVALLALQYNYSTNDTIPYRVEKAYTQEYFIYARFQLFDLGITEKAMELLSFFPNSPGQISMYAAAIAHTYFPIDLENKKLITYEWLRTILDEGCPDKETLRQLWTNQYTERGNLVDIIDAFMLANDEELKHLENEPM